MKWISALPQLALVFLMLAAFGYALFQILDALQCRF